MALLRSIIMPLVLMVRGRQGTEEWAPYTSRHTTETLFSGSAPPLDQVVCTFLPLGK